MAGVEASASLFGSGASVAVKAVPPPVWVLLAGIVGVGVVLFHQWTQTPDDVSWTNPEQPPDNLPVGSVVPDSVSGLTHGTHGMRGRQADNRGPALGSWSTIPTLGRPEAATWGGIS